MKIVRALVAIFLLMCLARVAAASPVDVNFGVKDPYCLNNCIFVNSTSFSFTMPQVASGSTQAIVFLNNTGLTLTSLSLDLFTGTSVTNSLFTCSVASFFNTCLVTQLSSSSISGTNEFHVLLENLNVPSNCQIDNDSDDSCGGIPPNSFFEFEFTNPPGTDASLDWAANGVTINVTSATPEPETLALFATGLIPLWSLRRKRLRPE